MELFFVIKGLAIIYILLYELVILRYTSIILKYKLETRKQIKLNNL